MIEQALADYGYLAVLVGTMLEGETVLILAGFAAHQGYLSLPLVMLTAFAGSFTGDQLWYALARRYGAALVARRPRLAGRLGKATALLERYPTLFILGFRFAYGIRNVAPFAIAMSRIPARRFVALNLVAAALWAVLAGGVGYLFGHAVELVLGDLRRWEERGLAALVLAGLAWLIFRAVRRRLARGRPG